jgi:hypothetical protein
MTPLLGVFFIPYRTSIIHPTLWHWTRKHLHRRLTCAEAERCRAVASLGGEHPHPSRKARKILLPRAYSASGSPIPRSPPKTAAERCRAGASLGGEHPHPSRIARKIILHRAYSASGGRIPRSHRNDRSRVESVPFCVNRRDRPLTDDPLPKRSGTRPERALKAIKPTPRA